MSVDADRVVNLCVSLHELWSLPAQIAIALFLLYTQVRLHSIVTVTVACNSIDVLSCVKCWEAYHSKHA